MRTALTCVLAVLLVAAATAGEFLPGDRPQHGYGRYRVSMAVVEGVDDPSVLGRQLSGAFGGKIESVSEASAVVRMTERSARMWSEHPRVLVVEEIVADNGNETWTTGTYSYDGAGNVKSIDTTKFTYDAFGRLTKGGSGGGHHQSYTYDNYGNILTVTTDGNTSTQLKLGVDPATNRISRTTSAYNVWGQYDAAGRMTSYQNTQTFTYDGLDMIKESTVNGTRRLYLYTPKNERLAVITVNAGGQELYSNWAVRETSGQVIRRFTRTGGTWRWEQDYIHRDRQLLASDLLGGVRRYFHLDHLGTPRLITNGNGTKIAEHNYYPFGLEETSSLQDNEALKFTGHERDATLLDHMHARSYLPAVGRFLSVDPVLGEPAEPQSWNRYAYVRSSPVMFTDPTGEFIDVSGLTDDERNKLIGGLNGFTGNTYAVDPQTNRVVLVSVGQNSSATATTYLDGLINSTTAYTVVPTTKPGTNWYNATQNRIELAFNAFDGADYNGVDPQTFNLGSTAIHEWTHQTTGLFDSPDGQRMTPRPDDYSWTGPVVDAVNVMRAERGLPTRAAYHSEPVRPAGVLGALFGIGQPRHAIRFLDHRGRIVKVIRNGR